MGRVGVWLRCYAGDGKCAERGGSKGCVGGRGEVGGRRGWGGWVKGGWGGGNK